MKPFYVVLLLICSNVTATVGRISHLEVNGKKYGVLYSPEIPELEYVDENEDVKRINTHSNTHDEKVGFDNDKPAPATSEKLDFEKPIYIADEELQKLKKGYKIPFNIAMGKEIKGSFELTDAQQSELAHYFQVSSDHLKVIVEVKDDIPRENLKKNPVIFILKFVSEESKDDFCHTTLVIFLQDKPAAPTKITFDESEYRIDIFPEYAGNIRQFEAKLDNNDGKTVIKYSLIFENTENDISKSFFKINELNGMLEKTQSAPPGQYSFKISAKTSEELHAEVVIHLIVSHAVICDSGKPKFPYAQVIKRFPENKTGDILLPVLKLDDKCACKITSQEPQGDYFKLDEKTAALKLIKEVEVDSVFKDIKNAKFIIKLSVNCDTKPAGEDKTKKDADQSSATDIFNIANNPDEMILILYIDKPTSSVFSTKKIVVGYPKDYDVILNHNIPLVTTVTSLVNEPSNAIQYSIVEKECLFGIHPSKGDIYPLNLYASDKDHTFTVLAKDTSKNVPTEGKLTVTIKFLAVSELLEVYFVDKAIDLDKLLLDYGSKLGMKIRPLTRAVIPITEEMRKLNKFSDKEKQSRILKTLSYAFDEKEENFLKIEIIEQKLTSLPEVLTTSRISHTQDDGTTSFAITSKIIAVILALAVVIAVIYFVFVRRKNMPTVMMRRSNARSSVTPLEDDMEAPSRTRWISPNINLYNRYDQMDANSFPNTSYETRRVSYSNTNGEIVIMENRTQTTSNDLLSSGITSFKPDPSTEVTTSHNVDNIYHDLEFPSVTGTNHSSSAPVLDVTALPPVSNERRRKKTNGDT